jgi:hypothetical protein
MVGGCYLDIEDYGMHFVWLSIRNLTVFLGQLWSIYFDCYKLVLVHGRCNVKSFG